MNNIKLNLPDDVVIDENTLVERLLANQKVTDLLSKYHASETVVKNYPWVFNEWLKSMNNNEDSYGSFTDDNSAYYKDIVIEDDYPRIVIRKSKMQKQNDVTLSHKKNYLMCDLSDAALLYDIDKIDLSRESESYRTIHKVVKAWLAGLPEKGIYFYGGLGVGKSYLAACMTNYLAKKGHKVAFVNVPKFFSKARNSVGVKDEYNRKEDFVNDSLNKLKRAQFVVLDDIGAENVTNWVRDDILLPLLDYRMEYGKSTIFTSNSDFKDLRERLMYNQYGNRDETKADRIMERIRTLATDVRVDGTSRRK